MAATFQIHEGRQWRVANLEVRGPNQLDISSLRDRFHRFPANPLPK